MSASERALDVEGLRRISLARHDHLRVDVATPAGVTGTDLVRGAYVGALPLRAVVKQQGPTGDLIGTFWANVYAVTERFAATLQRLGVTGWQLLPLAVDDQSGLAGIGLLTVTGRCGPVDEVGVARHLDPRAWDGSDIFMPANSRAILVVRDVADLLAREQLVDLDLEPAGLEHV